MRKGEGDAKGEGRAEPGEDVQVRVHHPLCDVHVWKLFELPLRDTQAVLHVSARLEVEKARPRLVESDKVGRSSLGLGRLAARLHMVWGSGLRAEGTARGHELRRSSTG